MGGLDKYTKTWAIESTTEKQYLMCPNQFEMHMLPSLCLYLMDNTSGEYIINTAHPHCVYLDLKATTENKTQLNLIESLVFYDFFSNCSF